MAQPMFSRWMQDDAFALQLKEAGGNAALFGSLPDPRRARAWLVALCLYRFDDKLRDVIRRDLEFYGRTPGGIPIVQFFFGVMADIASDPSEYPFCLSEREFAYYSKQNFGDTIENVEGIYKPPNFYVALMQDIGSAGFGVVLGAAVGVMLPETAAGAGLVGTFSPALAKTMLMGIGSATLNHLMPGGSWDAAKKNRLWPRYELDYKRRLLP